MAWEKRGGYENQFNAIEDEFARDHIAMRRQKRQKQSLSVLLLLPFALLVWTRARQVSQRYSFVVPRVVGFRTCWDQQRIDPALASCMMELDWVAAVCDRGRYSEGAYASAG